MYGQDRVYKKVEIIGVSKNSIEDAIKSAVGTAHKTLEKLSWFEVGDIRDVALILLAEEDIDVIVAHGLPATPPRASRS